MSRLLDAKEGPPLGGRLATASKRLERTFCDESPASAGAADIDAEGWSDGVNTMGGGGIAYVDAVGCCRKAELPNISASSVRSADGIFVDV